MITVKKAAELTGKSPRTIHNLIKRLLESDPGAISKKRNKFLINKDVLKVHYDIKSDFPQVAKSEHLPVKNLQFFELNLQKLEKIIDQKDVQIERLHQLLHENSESRKRSDILLQEAQRKLVSPKKTWFWFK